MFKVNNKDTRVLGVFIVNLEHISHLILVFLLLPFCLLFTMFGTAAFPILNASVSFWQPTFLFLSA